MSACQGSRYTAMEPEKCSGRGVVQDRAVWRGEEGVSTSKAK